MQPDEPGGHEGPPVAPDRSHLPGLAPGIPSLREYMPSVIFGAALPIGVYFLVRASVETDVAGLVVAGCVSVAWIILQFARQRRVDLVGVLVLVGFAIGVASSTLLGGNSYVLKVRDGFFTGLFGVACIVTVFTHDRPALFYLGRYLSAGNDPAKLSAYDRLHEIPIGRHAFRVLSVVWGIVLVVEAAARLALADMVPTATFLAVAPFVTGTLLGSLFVFTVLYVKHQQAVAAAIAAQRRRSHTSQPAHDSEPPQIPLR